MNNESFGFLYPSMLTTQITDFRPNSIRQRLAELRLDSKSRGGGDDETL